jgi:hypothetical protein
VPERYSEVRATSTTRAVRAALELEPLLDSALKRSRRTDFSSRTFIPSLEHLLTACDEEADLSVFGAWALRFDVLRCLRNLLRFDELEARSPALLSAPVRAPIFITGMPRSGTTFLHRLVLQDPNTVAPRLFQLMHPGEIPSRSIGSSLRRTAVSLQLALFRLIVPELDALHPIGIDQPEECTDILAQVFHSSRFESTYRVPSYGTWLRATGFLEAYRFHRRFLQHLQAQNPERRWILKSPDHVFALDDLKKVYPDARLIVVHRDPVRVLASVAKLTEVLRRPFARGVDPIEIGREVTASWIDGTRRMSTIPFDEDSVLHLHYQEIVAHPLRTVDSVYRHCGMTLTGEAVDRVSRWLNRLSTEARPARRYDLGYFGLDPHSLRDAFAQYTEKFRVEVESERVDRRKLPTLRSPLARTGS